MNAIRELLAYVFWIPAAVCATLAAVFAYLGALVAPGQPEERLQPPEEWLHPRPKPRAH